VTIQLTDRDPNNALASLPKLVRSSVLVRSWSTSYAAAHALAVQLHASLNGQKLSYRGHSFLRSIVASGMRDVYESDVDAYGIEQEFRIWHYYDPVTALDTDDLLGQAFIDLAAVQQHQALTTADLTGQAFIDPTAPVYWLHTDDVTAQAFLDPVESYLTPVTEIAFTTSFGDGELLPQAAEEVTIGTTAVLADQAMTIEGEVELSFSTEIFDDGAP
jgi:hypothetical protein